MTARRVGSARCDDSLAARSRLRRIAGGRNDALDNRAGHLPPRLFEPPNANLADADCPASAPTLRQLDGAAARGSELLPVALLRCATTSLHARSGRAEDARRELELLSADGFALLSRDHTWLASIAFLGEACAILADRARGAALYDLLRPYESEVVIVGHPALHYEGSVDRILGLLATSLERWTAARRHFERGIALDQRMGAPLFVASAQCEYARMLMTAARRPDPPVDRDWPGPDAALRLLSASIETTARLGMEGWLREAVALRDQVLPAAAATPSRTIQPPATSPPAAGSSAFLDEGAYWTIRYGGVTIRARASKGMRYLRLLLGRPGRELHALEIVACVGARDRRRDDAAAAQTNGFGDAGEHLDAAAKAAYQRRQVERREEIEEARAKSPAERARVNVSRSISRALDRIRSQHPALGEHFARTIHTGTFCSYAPDPRLPIEWTV